MNKNTPYEKLIAEKLDQVSLPEMADDIWSRIETQLDTLEQTPDTNDNAGAKTNNRLKGKRWYGISGAVIITAAAWWYTANKSPVPGKVSPAPEIITPAETIADSSDMEIKPLEKKKTLQLKKDTVSIIGPLQTPLLQDSGTIEIAIPPAPTIDSPVKHVERVFETIDTMMEKQRFRKPRGVKGLTDDDYKIKVTKDSTAKKE